MSEGTNVPHKEEQKVPLKVLVPDSVDRAVEKAAFEGRTTKQQIVEDAIREHLKLDNPAA